MSQRELADTLARVLEPPLGPVTIDRLTRLTAGASRLTWSFDAVIGDGTRHELILQRNRGGATMGLAFEVEDRLLAGARAAGVPLPEVVVDATGCAVLGDGRISRRVGGETLGPRIVRGEDFAAVRGALIDQMASALAAVHAIDLDRVAGVDGLSEADPLRLLRGGFDALSVVSPAFELALRWLVDHQPDGAPRGVVHGDFRFGNLIVDQVAGLQAVLDWELAHLGDPIEDLGWLCVRAWRFGGDGVVGGIGTLAELLTAYRAASGRDVTEAHVRWWMVAGTLRWGLICAVQASRHLRGEVESVELATVGRRIAENEHDILDLLDVPAHPHDTPLPTVDQGRPDAGELVAAVRRHLLDNVMSQLAGGVAYSTKVAANALGIVERELAATPRPPLDIDEDELAAQIRAGAPVTDAGRSAIRAAVTSRIMVANPKWVERS